MGISLNTQENRTHSYVNSAKDLLRIVGVRFFSYFLRNESLFLLFSKQKDEYLKSIKTLKKFTEDIIEQRMSNYKQQDSQDSDKNEYGVKKRTTLMDLLLGHLNEDKIDFEGVREEIDTFMAAVSKEGLTQCIMFKILVFLLSLKSTLLSVMLISS